MKKILSLILVVMCVFSATSVYAKTDKVDNKVEIIEKKLKVEKSTKKSDHDIGKEKLL